MISVREGAAGAVLLLFVRLSKYKTDVISFAEFESSFYLINPLRREKRREINQPTHVKTCLNESIGVASIL
jgi:hypothetical protein